MSDTPKYQNKEWLKNEFVGENKSARQIAREWNKNNPNKEITYRATTYWINKYKIVKKYDDPDYIYAEFVIKRNSINKIAKNCKTTWKTINERITDFGITRKSKKEIEEALRNLESKVTISHSEEEELGGIFLEEVDLKEEKVLPKEPLIVDDDTTATNDHIVEEYNVLKRMKADSKKSGLSVNRLMDEGVEDNSGMEIVGLKELIDKKNASKVDDLEGEKGEKKGRSKPKTDENKFKDLSDYF